MGDDVQVSGAGNPGSGEIFQLMRDGVARTKAELAALTGLSRSTLGARLEPLLSAGLLQPAGEATSTGGRPPAQLAFNPGAGTVIAVDFGATHVTVGVADLSGTILTSQTRTIAIALGPVPLLDDVMRDAKKLLAESGHDAASVLGVGIGVPGPVEHATGKATSPPIMPGWDRFDIPAHVQQSFAVPVLVDNDVNILALGERAVAWPEARDLIFVKVATGIGSGIIAGGSLQRGAQGSAGDLGHVHVPAFAGDSADDPRDLEARASGTAIAEHLRSLGRDTPDSGAAAALARRGDPDAVRAVREAGRVVGAVLASVVNLLNPSVIVLGGSVARAGEHLLAGVREVVYQRSIPLATQHLQIVQSQAGEMAAVMGAAIMVAHDVLSAAKVNARLAQRTARVADKRQS